MLCDFNSFIAGEMICIDEYSMHTWKGCIFYHCWGNGSANINQVIFWLVLLKPFVLWLVFLCFFSLFFFFIAQWERVKISNSHCGFACLHSVLSYSTSWILGQYSYVFCMDWPLLRRWVLYLPIALIVMKHCDFFCVKWLTFLYTFNLILFTSVYLRWSFANATLSHAGNAWLLLSSFTVIISTLRLVSSIFCLLPLPFVLLPSLSALFQVNSLMTFMGPLFLIDAIFKDHIKLSQK